MFLYNITFKIDWSIHDEWLQWMQEKYIPYLLSQQNFYDYKLYKILNIDEQDGATYALQMFAKSKSNYNRFIETQLKESEQMQSESWKNNMLTFTTLMQAVH